MKFARAVCVATMFGGERRNQPQQVRLSPKRMKNEMRTRYAAAIARIGGRASSGAAALSDVAVLRFGLVASTESTKPTSAKRCGEVSASRTLAAASARALRRSFHQQVIRPIRVWRAFSASWPLVRINREYFGVQTCDSGFVFIFSSSSPGFWRSLRTRMNDSNAFRCAAENRERLFQKLFTHRLGFSRVLRPLGPTLKGFA